MSDVPQRPYVESTIIMTTVRLVAPFVLTFGLFVTLHGADSPGGGFQGGVILASVVVMLSFAFGIELTHRWVRTPVVSGLIVLGISMFGLIGLGSILFGGVFLELVAYPLAHSSKYGIELVEVTIAMIVTGVLISLFFLLASGMRSDAAGSEGEGL